MERKTLGSFLSALRKANGMTQKELAERLHVSDKSVSRWERDECAPDLSLIPVLAEIFSVSCDELLRGERLSASAPDTGKGEKQRQWLLRSTLSRYRSHTWIAMGLSLAGLLAALMGNLVLLQGLLGFLLGALFFLAAVVCQAVFLNQALLAVADLPAEEAGSFRFRFIAMAQRSFGLTAFLLGFTLPLFSFSLSTEALLLLGLSSGAMVLGLYLAVCFLLSPRLLGSCLVPDSREAAVYGRNRRRKARCAMVLVLLLAVSALGQGMVHNRPASSYVSGRIFRDYRNFAEYMEQPLDANGYEKEPVYSGYDGYGNPIPVDDAPTEILAKDDGTVLVEYRRRNDFIAEIRYGTDPDKLPLTVYTYSDIAQGFSQRTLLELSFFGLYGLEILAVTVWYFLKRER